MKLHLKVLCPKVVVKLKTNKKSLFGLYSSLIREIQARTCNIQRQTPTMQLAKTDVELSEHVIKYTQSSCTGIYNGVLKIC
jgi:hypothetical protein